jgi:hypothetical protein
VLRRRDKVCRDNWPRCDPSLVCAEPVNLADHDSSVWGQFCVSDDTKRLTPPDAPDVGTQAAPVTTVSASSSRPVTGNASAVSAEAGSSPKGTVPEEEQGSGMGPSAIAAIGAGVAVAIAVAALLVVVVVRRRHAAFNAEIERRELSGTLASESTWFSGRRPSFYV